MSEDALFGEDDGGSAGPAPTAAKPSSRPPSARPRPGSGRPSHSGGQAPSDLDGERMVYEGSTGSAPPSRPGTASMPVRPVSARTWQNSGEGGASGSNYAAYSNDLFGDDEEENEIGVSNAPKQPQAAARQRMEQQKALQAQKRKERSLMSGVVVKNDSLPRSRPGSAAASRPGTARSSSSRTSRDLATSMQTLSMQKKQASESEQAEDSNTLAAQELKEELKAHGVKSVYDPGQQSEANPFPPMQRPMTVSAVDTSDMRVFLMQPGPKNGPILCHIRRSRGSAKMYPKYSLYIGGGGVEGEDATERFLLSARKRKKSKSSNYLISLDEEDMSRQSGNFFGKLRSNFVGTEFSIYDKGIKPEEAEGSSGNLAQVNVRTELGAVLFQYNVLGTRGPRKMTALIPEIDAEGNREVFRPAEEKDSILERFKEKGETDRLVVMRNKPPKWNDQMQAYCLNFHGRVTHASVKNFQLVSEDDKDHIILQFGKVGKDTFTMDYQYPISALQAFAICLTSFDNKLACE